MHTYQTQPILRTLRIIWAAMLLGIMTFGMIATLLVSAGRVQPTQDAKLFLIVWGALAVSSVVACQVVRVALVRSLRTQSSARAEDAEPAPAELAGPFLTLWIIPAAIAEGTAFFALIIYLISANHWGLYAAGASTLALAALFPSDARYRAFISAVTGQATAFGDERRL